MEHAWNPYYDEKMEYYYSQNAKELRKIVHYILYKKIGGIENKDLDHYYSIANDVFSEIVLKDTYDSSKGNFDGFLYQAIKNRIISDFYMAQKTDKRIAKIEDRDKDGKVILDSTGKPKRIPIQDVRLDAPIKNGENITYGEMVQDKFNLEEEILKNLREEYSDKMLLYLEGLSNCQKKVLFLTSEGYYPHEIMKILNINKAEYQNCYLAIHSYRNISKLI